MHVLLLVILAAGSPAVAQQVTSTVVVQPQAVAAGGTLSVWLVFLNTTEREVTQKFPPSLDGTLQAGSVTQTASMALRNLAEAGEVTIPPGGYVRREYVVTLPEGLEGPIILSVKGVAANPVVVEAQKAQVGAVASEAMPEKQPSSPQPAEAVLDAATFFREHVFGYEPMYFIAGTKSPNAKFQISFKYRLFSQQGSLVKQYPALKGINLAYTQTSLWDWKAPSAPFLDSSYKPEFFYALEQVDKGRWGKGYRLDLQGGFQHESNGKGGADSRSMNVAYLQPTFVVGEAGRLQLSLAPRAWAYVGSLDDNPDIAKFRGYVGLRAIAGWADSLQLSATGRVGDAWNRGSLQLDLTYPLQIFTRNLGLYLHLQYFWGYGETLLRYNDRTSSFRAGFSLFR
ncbi:MAG TPA: phospholipase A [Candidatus Methylomirabilis sp.]|nr:phospholipase A [Candidatus Methylomirabilis sp.]